MKTNPILSAHCIPLKALIETEYRKLIQIINSVPHDRIFLKNIPKSNGMISVMDLIAYQIGWGNLLIYWYQTGLTRATFPMPGEGFATWDYNGLAQHFYAKYTFTDINQAQAHFLETVSKIITIVEDTYAQETLDTLGIWPWCTLTSGKKWPLSKWIKINTASPYKAARTLIRSTFKNKLN